MSFNMKKTLHLRKRRTFYTSGKNFDVEIVRGVCGAYTDDNNQTYRLTMNRRMKNALKPYESSGFSASVEDMTEAAMCYYLPPGSHRLKRTLSDEALFLLRRDVGLYMDTANNDSIGKTPLGTGMRVHSEADGGVIEMFAYGAALAFMSDVLNIDIERFRFITGSVSRADFTATMTPKELSKMGISALGPGGRPIHIEVKGRCTPNGGVPSRQAFLLNLAKKCHSARRKGIFVAITVNFPRNARTATWRAKLQVYDPGTAKPLPEKLQVCFLLRQILRQAYRFGLWGTMQQCFSPHWLKYLGALTKGEQQAREFASKSHAGIQGKLLKRSFGGRRYRGRFFYTALELLGKPGERLLSPEAARVMLDEAESGQKWFRGIDVELEKIIKNNRTDELLRFGLREKGTPRKRPRSAFVSTLPKPSERDLDSSERALIKKEYKRAIKHFKQYKEW